MIAAASNLLQRLWYGRTFRTQLLVAIGLINLVALVVAGVIAILNARNATRVEIEASLEMAKRFVRVTIQSLTPNGKIDNLSKKVDQLSNRLQIARLRHVRIFIADAAGNLVQLSPEKSAGEADGRDVPRWFAALIKPTVSAQQLSVLMAEPAAGAVLMIEQPLEAVPKVWTLGSVVVAGEPADEIAEVWQDLSSLVAVLLVLDLLVLATLYLVLGRMLDPLAGLARGLRRLESGQYVTRLTPPKIKELGDITCCFNRLADALDRAHSENARLYGQLIDVQEDERREIANELHDEASPCLFGITANALSVERLTDRRRDRKSLEVRRHAVEILKIAERLKTTNRLLLKKLRPVALGRVALSALLEDLFSEIVRSHPELEIASSIRTRAERYGEAIDLAIYRCVQEGVTNAIRHGNARAVKLELFERHQAIGPDGERLGSTLELRIEDNGCGIPVGASPGFGLTVMRERVGALGGSCAIRSIAAQGTLLRITIPINTAPVDRTQHSERIEVM